MEFFLRTVYYSLCVHHVPSIRLTSSTAQRNVECARIALKV